VPARILSTTRITDKASGLLWKAVRVAAGPGSDMLGFVTIFAAALAGFSGLGAWAIAAAAIALASFSYSEHQELYRRGQELGLIDALRATVVRSFVNAFIASAGAYGAGALLRLI
jgi:hypothetical protein